jgi:biopolymer transport protein ExbB/TolQ
MANKYLPPFIIIVWIWLTLLLSLGVAWNTLAKIDFGYAIWYKNNNIEEHINIYAQQNRNKSYFELTSEEQRLDIFHQIVEAIQNKGKGLEEIVYKVTPKESQRVKEYHLLTEEEIIHLQDVANLIYRLDVFLFYPFFIWLIISIYKFKTLFEHTNSQVFVAIMTGGVMLYLPILIFGATKVFYKLHTWVFPGNHQWFFYYQDSLMSTMMKAPDLFGFITWFLLLTTIVIYALISKSLNFLQKMFN